MAARVLLLMALTGLFAAAWNSDRPSVTSAIQPSALRSMETKVIGRVDAQKRIDSKPSQSIADSQEFNPSSVTLPVWIAPGTYRVVDTQGRVGWITIPPVRQNAFTTDEPEPFYASQFESERWYFIRVDPVPLVSVPQKTGTVLR